MPEQPENPITEPKPKAPLWKRVRAWTVILGLYAVILGMAGFGVTLIRSNFRSGKALDDRLFLLLGGAALLIPLVRVAWVYLRSKWIKGRWLMTKQESAQLLSQCSARRFRASEIPPWSWIRFGVNWANYSAMEPKNPLWKRALGWTLLIAFVALMLLLTGFGVIFTVAGFATIASGGLVIIGFGALLFVVPIQATWSCIRRIRTMGSLRTPQEELRQMGVQTTEWQDRETQKPLRSKVVSTVIIAAILSGWWVRVTLHHPQHPHETWFNPALWTLFAIYAIRVQFRKPKNSPPQTSDPPASRQI